MKTLRTILSLNEDRKESTKIVTAFMNKKPAKGARTHSDGSSLFLHGNKIAWHGDNGAVHATLAGWNTTTTRERLNTLANHVGSGKKFSMKKGVGHYGSTPIDSRDVVNLKEDAEYLDEKRGIAGLIQRWKQRGQDRKPGLKFGNGLRKVKDGSRLTVNSANKKAKVLGTGQAADPRLAANKPDFKLKSIKTQAQAPAGKTKAPGKFLKTLPATAKKKPKAFAPKPMKPLVVKPIKTPKLSAPKIKSLTANAKKPMKMKPLMPKVNNAS